jgi:DNA repair exonuclease SbcCD ATPase subunit
MSDATYLLEELQLSGFRAYLVPKTFEFASKRCLAVFAPNASGKSSIIDALEFMFSSDGTLERLGMRTIHNQAGAAALVHNLAEEKYIESFVLMRFKRGTLKSEARRNASGATRERPIEAVALNACFTVNPIIRGHALRGFVEKQTSEERYEAVARWLQLGPLVDIQRNLRALRQRVKAAAEEQSSLTRVDAQTARKTSNAVAAWDDVAAMTYANALLRQLDETLSISSLDRADPVFITLQDRAKAEELKLGLEGLRQIRRAAVNLFELKHSDERDESIATGILPQLEDAVGSHAKARETEALERTAAANAIFDELWKAAEPLFAEGAPAPDICPICSTPITASTAGNAQVVRQHLATHRAELVAYAKAKKDLDAASITIDSVRARLISAIQTLQSLLSESYADPKNSLLAYLTALEAWNGGDLPEAEPLKGFIDKLIKALDVSIVEIEERQGENTYRKALNKIEELIELRDERELAVRTLDELGKLSTELTEQAGFISGEIRKKVQALLDTLQSPLNDIYRKIQGSAATAIRLELPSEDDTNQQRLNLVVDFAANREGVQPSGYLSDSQIHSLALALRLAAIKCFNTAAPIIALDDIVTSYDADHRRAIAALFATDFTDFQLIITTHDERFFIYLKDQLGDRNWHFTRIIRLDKDFGPRFVDHRISDAMIEDRWHEGESAANEMRQAEEEWLLQVCRDFGVDVRIRIAERAHSYERGELADALAAFLRGKGLTPPMVPGVNNRFLTSLQVGAVENFGSHFQDGPYGDGSKGDEQARWEEFKLFREAFACHKCGKRRFKRPKDLKKPVCSREGCEAQFEFVAPAPPVTLGESGDTAVKAETVTELLQ